MEKQYIIGACVVAAVSTALFLQSSPPKGGGIAATVQSGAMVDVHVPKFGSDATIGQRIFDGACAACHGTNAAGTVGVAPPLVHVIYEPNHHADEAFQRAAKLGVRSHHWRFGDMPPVDGLTRGDVKMIVTYIRELQRANGFN